MDSKLKGTAPVLNIVLLHGWGCDLSSWLPIAAQLQTLGQVVAIDLPGFGANPAIENFSADTLVDFIAAALPDQCVLLGWSLGGMLAVQVAARYPKKVSRVITLASNAKFVATRDYPSAMPQPVNRQFNASFAADPSATLKLFSGLLAQGDSNERALLKKMRDLLAQQTITANWQDALQLLAELDNREILASLPQPGLHLLGEMDALVPATAAAALAELNPGQQVQVLTQAAHAVHWSQPEKVIEYIAAFLQATDLQNTLAAEDDLSFKKRVAQSFSRAAYTYDAVASLQRYVGEKLLHRFAGYSAAEVVLDLGCGTGYFTQALQQKFPDAYVLAMDLAETMLQLARERNPWELGVVCGDAEYLPLASASVDVVFSSLALQWCHNLPLLFSELNRVLKPGGKLIFSTLGPETLHELKSAWQQVDGYVHVNRFISGAELRENLQAGNFAVTELSQEFSVLQFANLSDLTRELKALGAHNINRGQAEGLTGRKKIAAFKAAYEHFRRDNSLPATYDVFYVVAEKSSHCP